MLERKVLGIAVKWIALAVIIGLIVAFLYAKVIGWQRTEALQGRSDSAHAEADRSAGSAAVSTVLNRSQSEMDLQDLATTAAKEIDDAPSPAAARAAALNAACQLDLYRDDPSCKAR